VFSVSPIPLFSSSDVTKMSSFNEGEQAVFAVDWARGSQSVMTLTPHVETSTLSFIPLSLLSLSDEMEISSLNLLCIFAVISNF